MFVNRPIRTLYPLYTMFWLDDFWNTCLKLVLERFMTVSPLLPSYSKINVRGYRRGNQKCTIKRNWQHRVQRRRKTKTQHNMCWTPLCANCWHFTLSKLYPAPIKWMTFGWWTGNCGIMGNPFGRPGVTTVWLVVILTLVLVMVDVDGYWDDTRLKSIHNVTANIYKWYVHVIWWTCSMKENTK